jgi:flagellar motor switch protein FliG
LIVRRVASRNEFREEAVLRIGNADPVDPSQIQDALERALEKLLADDKERG